MFHAFYISYCIGTRQRLMTPEFVSNLLNLNIILLFYMFLFANSLSCSYLVILK
jgi:hypothetical protein